MTKLVCVHDMYGRRYWVLRDALEKNRGDRRLALYTPGGREKTAEEDGLGNTMLHPGNICRHSRREFVFVENPFEKKGGFWACKVCYAKADSFAEALKQQKARQDGDG